MLMLTMYVSSENHSMRCCKHEKRKIFCFVCAFACVVPVLTNMNLFLFLLLCASSLLLRLRLLFFQVKKEP